MKKSLLFFGDSITDSNRTTTLNAMTAMMEKFAATSPPPGFEEMPKELMDPSMTVRGEGFVNLIYSQLSYQSPGMYDVVNRGITGNRIVDLYARIKTDCINLKPDVVTIMIGVNDVCHELLTQNGVDAEKFERVYRWMLKEIKEALPDTKIILMEPYVLNGPATRQGWDYFCRETKLRQAATEKMASEFKLPLLKTQEIFDTACENSNQAYWTQDGVHPTAGGHALLAKHWLELFDTLQD